MKSKSVYLILSVEQLQAALELAKQIRGPFAESHATVSLTAELSGPEHDCNGKAQLCSASVALNGKNLNRYTYLGKA